MSEARTFHVWAQRQGALIAGCLHPRHRWFYTICAEGLQKSLGEEIPEGQYVVVEYQARLLSPEEIRQLSKEVKVDHCSVLPWLEQWRRDHEGRVLDKGSSVSNYFSELEDS